MPKGALAGTCFGLFASSPLHAGFGANPLNAGLERSILLQSFSVQTQAAAKVAASAVKAVLREAD